MNHNYYSYNFNPNTPFITRSVPLPQNIPNFPVSRNTLPRLSSLFSQSRAPLGVSQLTPRAASISTKALSNITPKLTFSQILSGTSKTLGVVNQAIPVFYQVKPIWKNAKTMFRVVKELNTKETNKTKNEIHNTTTIKQETKIKEEKEIKEQKNIQKKESNDSLTFFI